MGLDGQGVKPGHIRGSMGCFWQHLEAGRIFGGTGMAGVVSHKIITLYSVKLHRTTMKWKKRICISIVDCNYYSNTFLYRYTFNKEKDMVGRDKGGTEKSDRWKGE